LLIDNENNVLDNGSDILVLEAMGQSKFEVAFKRYDERITRYSIILEEMDEECFTQSFL